MTDDTVTHKLGVGYRAAIFGGLFLFVFGAGCYTGFNFAILDSKEDDAVVLYKDAKAVQTQNAKRGKREKAYEKDMGKIDKSKLHACATIPMSQLIKLRMGDTSPKAKSGINRRLRIRRGKR